MTLVRRRFSRPLARRAPRRQTVWGRFSLKSALTPGTRATQLPLANLETAIGGDLQGCTIIRTVGDFWVQMQASNANDDTQAVVGLIMHTAGTPALAPINTAAPAS